MAHLDFKVSKWRRVYIPDDKVEEVIERLKNGDVDTPYDLVDEHEGCWFMATDVDEECEEPLTVEDNNGDPVQQVFDKDGKCIYGETY
jgi:hypothetical protein